MKWSVQFEGGDELAKALDSLSTRVSRPLLREALLDAGEPMRLAASQLAPYEPGSPDLKANIGINAVKSTEMAAVAVGPTRDFFYGLFQEFGTSRHGAQPFMRPAFDTEAPKALTILARELWRLLAAKGIGRVIARPTRVQSDGRLL